MEDLSKRNVHQLKEELRRRGLEVQGKKAVLVERLKAAMEQEDHETIPCEAEKNKARVKDSQENEMQVHPDEERPIQGSKERSRHGKGDEQPPSDAAAPISMANEGTLGKRTHGNRKEEGEDLVENDAKRRHVQVEMEQEHNQTHEESMAERTANRNVECPYLDTVNRGVLDFDFEKCCSVSLSPVNVYACLVCGKYFQGRGPKSHAYIHSLEADHHMFMKLTTGNVYCLPDGYEVVDRSLDDIRRVLHADFSEDDISALDESPIWARSLDGNEYMPGTVGLNNTKHMDYANTILQCMMRVTPLRNFFLNKKLYQHCQSKVVQRFGELVRKLWNPHNFKGHVSPLEFMQTVSRETNKRFNTDELADPTQFLSWLLNALHLGLTDGEREKSSIISRCFQGNMQVTTEKGSVSGKPMSKDIVQNVPFFMLGLDLPPTPLYRDVMDKHAIPQIQLFTILQKYDGTTVTDDPRTGRRTFRILTLPAYLTLHVKRFSTNNFFREKNRTIVNFSIKGLDISTYLPLPKAQALHAKYNLVGNIFHQGPPEGGSYQCHVHRKSDNQWYQIEDLHVERTLPQVVSLSETYILVYERKGAC
mmetsp:Transcript_9088/g.55379  ORF Transcript_9088/g.55379 Transcript_9088/m.55379 type:complete len:591 (-) Transcript_9088:552-2324(-)